MNNTINCKRHFDKFLYNLTSRGFQGFIVAAFILIYVTLKIIHATPDKILPLQPIFSTSVTLFTACFALFLGKTGFEKYLQSKNGGTPNV